MIGKAKDLAVLEFLFLCNFLIKGLNFTKELNYFRFVMLNIGQNK